MRNKNIDALKGLAIFLVVVGHAIQTNVRDFDNDTVFRVIYSFHMPLFMLLSGYLAFGRDVNISKKAKALLIPFVVWYVSGYIFFLAFRSNTLTGYILEWAHTQFASGLWFLRVLFINFVLLYLTQKFDKKYEVIGQGIVFITLQFLPDKLFLVDFKNLIGLDLVKWYFLFFIVGYNLSKYRMQLYKYRKAIGVISLVGFPVLVSMWYRTDPIISFYNYVVAFLGIGFAASLVIAMVRTKAYPIFCYLGTMSLDIYVSHQIPIFYWGINYSTLPSGKTIAFVLGLGFSLGISFLLRKSALLSQLYYGQKSTFSVKMAPTMASK